MYEKFAELLHQKGITPYRVFKETGVSQTTLSDWKNGKSVPKIDKLQKIADYLGVPVGYFLNDGDQKETPPAKPEGQEPSGQKTLSTEEKRHIKKYRLLNEAGKEKTDEYMDLLLGNEDFRKSEKLLEVAARSGDHLQVPDNGALDDMIVSYPEDL